MSDGIMPEHIQFDIFSLGYSVGDILSGWCSEFPKY